MVKRVKTDTCIVAVTVAPFAECCLLSAVAFIGLQGKCELVVHDDRALLALQGPSAVKVLADLLVAACIMQDPLHTRLAYPAVVDGSLPACTNC